MSTPVRSTVFALVAFASVSTARAAPPPPRTADASGTVVRVDARELFVDLGGDDGLEVGDSLEVFRRIEIQHPVTRRTLVDRFPIGQVVVAEAGRLLSIVDDYGTLDPPPRIGDIVVRASVKATAAPGTAMAAAPAEPAAPCVGAAADAIAAVFEATLGLPLPERIALWQGWLREHTGSRDAPLAQRELAALNALRDLTRVAPSAPATPAVSRAPALLARVALPDRVLDDQPIELYLATLPREEVASARALVRRPDQEGYTTIPLEPDGRTGHRAALTEAWRAPGDLRVRLEVTRPSGAVEVVTGPEDRVITIERATRDVVDERGRSQASARVDWVSFWVDDDDDWFVRVEGDFRYRIGEGALEAFRMGVGTFEGRGGATDALDQGLSDGQGRSVNYGFAEIELALAPLFGAAGKLLVGTYQPGDRAEPLASLFGGALELRVGERDATRLYGGIQSTEHLGDEMWLRVAIAEVEGWPMEASVVVTDLPVGADYGVSLGYGLTWQASDLFAATLRLGWNARTINHSGFTLGTAVVLSW